MLLQVERYIRVGLLHKWIITTDNNCNYVWDFKGQNEFSKLFAWGRNIMNESRSNIYP